MLITCWGSRGSIPVSGHAYLKYGGDTTCIEIRARSGHVIVVDAGTGIRRLGNRLIREKLYTYHFLFTHAHWDHLMGLPFFKPLYLSCTEMQIYRCPFGGRYVEDMISKVLAPPHFPVRYRDLKARFTYRRACPNTFTIGSVAITPIAISHPNCGSGYKFVENGHSFVFLTDNELGYIHPGGLPATAYQAFCQDAELLFHDAEYTPREYKKMIEWGHSSYTDAISLAQRANVKRLGLFHLNQERADDKVDAIVADCHNIINASAGDPPLDCFAVGAGMTFSL
jgi:phosphoribosyl 1,2-cyclic phosphodiesterase